jgi:hypothetical protein
MTEIECAWLAGYLEGGTFRSELARNESRNRVPVVEIKSVHRDVIDKVSRLCGGYAVVRRPPDKPGRREQFRVRVTGSHAVQIMNLVRPHMGARSREKIDLLIASH